MARNPSDRDARSTFINFSRPQRAATPSSMPRKPPSSGLDYVDEDGELRSYNYSRPIKSTRFVQFHVTSNDLNTRARGAEVKRDDPSAENATTIDDRILKTSSHAATDAAPTPPTMPIGRVPVWPKRYQEKAAGSYSFDEAPTLTRTPWEMRRGESSASRRHRASSSTSSSRLSWLFEQVPPEVFQSILDQLERTYAKGTLIDVASLQIDLRSLCRVDKRWSRVAKEFLYRDLWLPKNRTPPKKKKFSFQAPKSTLQMLIATFHKSPSLARLVLRLRIPSELTVELDSESLLSFAGPTLSLLQEIIRLCPNLEQLHGYLAPTASSNTNLTTSLSTLPRLKSHAWKLDPSQPLLPNLSTFISFHDQWTRLETLALSANKGVDLGLGTLSAILTRLPSLKHLMLTGIHPADFNDATLFTLPRLRSLRLDHLAGLTDQGVEQIAFSALAPSLHRLSLIGLELLSLQTVQTLLSHLTRLRRLVFVQESSPEPLMGFDEAGKALVLESGSLRELHWDCVMLGTATASFAEGIAEGRFPRLSKVRVPCDYDGVVQAVSRPIEQVNLTDEEEDYLKRAARGKSGRSMRAARLLALQRTLRTPAVRVVVQEEGEMGTEQDLVGGYLGDVRSQVEYRLDEVVGDRALAEFEDVVRDPGREGEQARWERKLDLGMLF